MNRLQLASWSKEQTSMLLQELQQYPVIYDQTHPLFRYRPHRLAALRKIIAKLRPIKPNMTPQLISSKIRVLKSQYCKEKKYIRDSLVNLKPGQKPYKSKLWCFHMLMFLDKKGTYDKNSIPSALPEEEEEEIEDTVEESYVDESNDPINSFEEVEMQTIVQAKENEPVKNSQTRSVLHTKCLKLVECLTKEMGNVKEDEVNGTNQQSPITFLGQMVESELSKVTEEIYDDAKWKIIRVLEEASKKNREGKMHPVQIHLPLTSATASPPAPSYNLGRKMRVTVLDKLKFKSPIQVQTQVSSKQKIAEISRMQNK